MPARNSARQVPQSGEPARARERRPDSEVSTARALTHVRALRARLLLRCRERARNAARRAAELFRAAQHVPQSGEPTRVRERRQDGEVSTARALANVRALRARLLLPRCRERARNAARRAEPRAGELFRATRRLPQSEEMTRVREPRPDGKVSTARALAYVRALHALAAALSGASAQRGAPGW
jgi:hypothetical protein